MNSNSTPFKFEYLPLLIQLECCETTHLPAYLGSTLHGVVGWALTSNSKAYSFLFENRKFGGAKQDIVNPYIIEPPRYRPVYKPGDVLSFQLILLGTAASYVKDVVEALASVKQFGIGANRKPFKLINVLHGERYVPIWQAGEFYSSAANSEVLSETIQEDCSWCSIQFLTPLRIRRGGELLLKLDFLTIIRNTTKRIEMLTERYGGYCDSSSIPSLVDQSANVIERTLDVYVTQIHRYSNRREEKMDMSGLLGAMTFEGELSAFTPWLKAARKLHIGRNTTFGYGQLDVIFG